MEFDYKTILKLFQGQKVNIYLANGIKLNGLIAPHDSISGIFWLIKNREKMLVNPNNIATIAQDKG